MKCLVYVIQARINIVTGKRLGIVFPARLQEEMAKHRGKRVTVVIYVPEEESESEVSA